MPRAGARVPPGPKFGKAGTLSGAGTSIFDREDEPKGFSVLLIAKGWTLMAMLASAPLLGAGPATANAGESCDLRNVMTGSDELTPSVTSWYLTSDCTGETTLEMVVVWRGPAPNWSGTSTSLEVVDPEAFGAISREHARRMFETAKETDQWAKVLGESLCGPYGYSQASAFSGFLWGTIWCMDTNHWHIVHATDRDNFTTAGRAEISLKGGEVVVLYVGVDSTGARIIERENRAPRIVPPLNTPGGAFSGGVVLAFLEETEFGVSFLEDAPTEAKAK